MGGSTFAIGLVPKYETIGFAAPLIVLLLRLLQGLALGGEYGGAATYVAEHSPEHRRGYFTSWIQTTATVGLLVSLGVILLVRHLLDADPVRSIEKFEDWGWRIPFLVSIVLVVVSIYIRLKMSESPLFSQLKAEKKLSVNPLKESFGHKENLKMVLLALFGATMGQGVVFYAGQFYAQTFLENTCHLDFEQAKTILILAIVFATPFFLVFGGWSDRVGRKWIMMTGLLLAACTYHFIFGQLVQISNPKGRTEVAAQKELRNSVAFVGKKGDVLRSNSTITHFEDGMVLTETRKDTLYSGGIEGKKKALSSSVKLGQGDYWKMVAWIFLMVIYVTMVYGPIAAFLVELFPTKIRYTSMSLPYHIGNGVFGGLTPFIATLLTTVNKDNLLAGLGYPVAIAGLCLFIGVIYIGSNGMGALKKALGYLWILLGPAALLYLLWIAIHEIGKNPAGNTIIQWSVFVVIFIPIAIGLVIFGYYATKGEYESTGDQR
jgi:MFS family permease